MGLTKFRMRSLRLGTNCYLEVMQILLIFLVSLLGFIYYFTGDTDGTLIIVTMVTISVVIRFFTRIQSKSCS